MNRKIQQLILCLFAIVFVSMNMTSAMAFSDDEEREFFRLMISEAFAYYGYEDKCTVTYDEEKDTLIVITSPDLVDQVYNDLSRWGILMKGVTTNKEYVRVVPAQTLPGSAYQAKATANVNVRSGPGTNYGIIGTLNIGHGAAVVSVSGSWAKIIWSNNTHAYVYAKYLERNDEIVSPQTGSALESNAVATGRVNVRMGPGTAYKILGRLTKGQSATVISLAGKWAQIIWWTGEDRAFVHTDYLKIANSGSISENIPSTDPGTVGAARATGNVNVRTGPGIGYTKIGTLTKGQTAAVWSITGHWAEITWTGGMRAYVHMSYLKFED